MSLPIFQPDAALGYALALPVSAPVPAGTPARNLSERPPPGIGPYRVAGVRPGERLVLSRTRDFELPDLPSGNVDEVTIERFGTAERQAAAVGTGTTLDVMQELPPAAELPEIRAKYADRYAEQTTASTLFLALDRTQPPLDDPKVRQAISLAVDGPRLDRLYAGRLDPGCNLLPPSVPGYRRLDPCPYGDRDEPPDLLRARQLVDESGQQRAVVVVGVRPDIASVAVTHSVLGSLRKIGLVARPGNPRSAGVSFELLAPPVAYPSAFLAFFRGATGDLEIDSEIDQLLGEPQPDDGDWADLDETLVDDAYAAPLGSQTLPTFLSERIDVQACSVFHPVFGTDLAALCLR